MGKNTGVRNLAHHNPWSWGLCLGGHVPLPDQNKYSGWGLGNKDGEGGHLRATQRCPAGPESVSLGALPVNWG